MSFKSGFEKVAVHIERKYADKDKRPFYQYEHEKHEKQKGFQKAARCQLRLRGRGKTDELKSVMPPQQKNDYDNVDRAEPTEKKAAAVARVKKLCKRHAAVATNVPEVPRLYTQDPQDPEITSGRGTDYLFA